MRIDLHADTPLIMHWAGYDFCRSHTAFLPRGAWVSHVDLPRMERANLDAQVFGLVTLPGEPNPFGSLHGMINTVYKAAANSNGKLQVVRTVEQLRQARVQGARAAFLSVEGVHPLRGKLERAEELIERGVVSFGLAHFHANEACFPSKGLGRQDEKGLTAFGKDLVRLLGERGVLVDLTHVNRKGFDDALDCATGPVFVSHTGVNGAHQHWRNLDDQQLRQVANRGGVVGIIFARQFVGGDDIEAVVRHIKHTVNVGGEAVAALGSDYDGFVVPVKGLRDISGLPALAEALLRSGLSQRVVDGVMGNNASALFERALG